MNQFTVVILAGGWFWAGQNTIAETAPPVPSVRFVATAGVITGSDALAE